MKVAASSTLTVLHGGQFWVGICERAESGLYGACRVVFGATEPSDAEILDFVCARWEMLPIDLRDDSRANAKPLAANPKRRQREARKAAERAGFGTKARIRVNGQYRLCFRWTEAGAADVELVDYH